MKKDLSYFFKVINFIQREIEFRVLPSQKLIFILLPPLNLVPFLKDQNIYFGTVAIDGKFVMKTILQKLPFSGFTALQKHQAKTSETKLMVPYKRSCYGGNGPRLSHGNKLNCQK